MTSSAERARREEAHLVADMAWTRDFKRSRTDGLGDLVRSIGASQPVPAEVRALRQENHKRKLRTFHAKELEWSGKNRPWNPRVLDRSRYFPHQSDRQRTRGTRRALAA